MEEVSWQQREVRAQYGGCHLEALAARGCPARGAGGGGRGGQEAASRVGGAAGDGGAGEEGEEAAGDGALGITWGSRLSS